MNLSQNGARFIAEFEGTYLRRYNDPVGHCTVGIGHLLHYGRCDGRAGEFDLPSKEAAWDLLIRDIAGSYGPAVERLITVPLNQNQYDALVSFTFNCGVGALQGSTLRRKLNAGDYGSVCAELRKWSRASKGALLLYVTPDPFAPPFAGTFPLVLDPDAESLTAIVAVVLPGLVRRREAECQLFHKPDGQPVSARDYVADWLVVTGGE